MGLVATSGKTLTSSNIQKDYRFDVQIDDPHFSED